MNRIFTVSLSVCLLLLAGCTADKEVFDLESIRSGTLMLRMAGQEGSPDGTADAGSIKDLTGMLFEGGVLTDVFSGLSLGEGGEVKGMTVPDAPGARLYFLANAGGLTGEKPVPGSLFEHDFRKMTFASELRPEQGGALVMTGYCELGSQPQYEKAEALLTRCFARFDVEPAEGVTVSFIRVDDVAQSVYLFGQETVKSPEDVQRVTLERIFDAPLTGRQEGVFYLYEQAGQELQVEILAEVNGVKNKLTAALPDVIKRNHVYNLKVTAVGAHVQLLVQEQPWSEGDVIEATPDLSQKVKVDVTQSVLDNGVRVSESRDTVYIPYYGSAFELALQADTELVVRLAGVGETDREVTVAPVTSTIRTTGAENVMTANRFSVTTKLTAPGSEERYVYLEVRNKNLSDYYGDRIVLTIEKNKTVFTGRIYTFFNGKAACEMTEYADGDLGIAELTPGSTLTFEGNWIKVVPVEEEEPAEPGARMDGMRNPRYRILGGYKPNDPEADGRTQHGQLVVNHVDGKREVYPVSRPNNGLPVTFVDGKYWCKFNLKGNARSFEDQIQINDPAAQAQDLYEYLKTCEDREYMRLMGDAYKGWHTGGLELKYRGEGVTPAFAYENYASTPGGPTINSADPTLHCPPGYQVPSSADDYFSLFGNRTWQFPSPDSDAEQQKVVNDGGVSKTAHRFSRLNINHDGGIIPRLYLNKIEFAKDGQNYSYALFSSGVQTNNTTMDWTLSLFANTTATGFLTQAGGKFLTQTNRTVSHTRAIRCIKSPVEFIIAD